MGWEDHLEVAPVPKPHPSLVRTIVERLSGRFQGVEPVKIGPNLEKSQNIFFAKTIFGSEEMGSIFKSNVRVNPHDLPDA